MRIRFPVLDDEPSFLRAIVMLPLLGFVAMAVVGLIATAIVYTNGLVIWAVPLICLIAALKLRYITITRD